MPADHTSTLLDVDMGENAEMFASPLITHLNMNTCHSKCKRNKVFGATNQVCQGAFIGRFAFNLEYKPRRTRKGNTVSCDVSKRKQRTILRGRNLP
eukprot:312810-Pyramimonas_sp.AAC.1